MQRERITITIRHDVVKKIDTFIDGQKVRNRSNAIETIVMEHFKNHILQKAVILGGGHGIALKGETIAKVLLPIDGKTLLERNIETLKTFGVNEIVMAAGDWKKAIWDVVGDGTRLGVKITYHEKEDGTAGILKYLKNVNKETFFMVNGDILLEDIDIEDMYLFHKKNGGLGTIGLTTVSDSSMLGSIFMKGSRIVDFKEKLSDKKMQSQIINAGVYMLEPQVADMATANFTMMEHDIFPKLAAEKKLFGYQIEKDWTHLHDEAAYDKYLRNRRVK